MTLEIPYFLFGVNFVSLGLRKKDKILNNNKNIFRSWGGNVVKDRVNEIKSKMEKGELESNPKDIIEAITRNSLKEKK